MFETVVLEDIVYLCKHKLGKRVADWSGKSHVTIAEEPNQVIKEVDLSMDVVLRGKGSVSMGKLHN